MDKHNSDLMPALAAHELFAEVAPLVGNPRIARAFSRHEAQAVRAKRRYHRMGRLGTAMVLVGTFYTVAEALVLPISLATEPFAIAAILIGLSGLALQIYLILSRTKQRWLLSRFAAERIRSIAFQAYPLAISAKDTADLTVAVDSFYQKALAQLEFELNAGIAALDLYRPQAALCPFESNAEPTEPNLTKPAREAYLELRLNYQRRFAAGELARINEGQEVIEKLSDILYVAGGALALAGLAVKLLSSKAALILNWIDFTAISAFILGLAANVLDGATINTPSRDRYSEYVKELDSAVEAQEKGETLEHLVRRVELIALVEMAEFCTAARRISYRL